MRKQLLLSFLKKNGFDKVEIKPIKSDASSRKYFRINNNKNGRE